MTPEEAARQRETLLASIEMEDALTLKVAGAIPIDKVTWKPDAGKSWRTNDLTMHIAGAGLFFTSVVDGTWEPGAEAPPAPETKEALLEGIRQAQAGFQSRLSAYTPQQLAGETEFFGNLHPNVTILSWHKDHMIHHRGQLALYLRLMGAKVPSTYGPSGDEDYIPEPAGQEG